MEKVVRMIENQYGDEIPAAILIQEDGLLRLWEINCLSALHYGLGNCHCENHLPSDDYPISTEEVVDRFGIEALDGFEAPGPEQLCFDAFGIEIDEMENYLRISYELGLNPLPALRNKFDANIVFAENPELLVFPDSEPGAIVFIVNSRGEISVKAV